MTHTVYNRIDGGNEPVDSLKIKQSIEQVVWGREVGGGGGG